MAKGDIPPAVVAEQEIVATWGNTVRDFALGHVSHAFVSGAFGAVTLQASATHLGSLDVPSAGLWLVSVTMDVNTAGAGWGFVSCWVSKTQAGAFTGQFISNTKWYEQGTPAVNVRGDSCCVMPVSMSAPGKVYAVGNCYATTKGINGCSIYAWRMYEGEQS